MAIHRGAKMIFRAPGPNRDQSGEKAAPSAALSMYS